MRGLIKLMISIVGVVLLLLALLFFSIAIRKSFSIEDSSSSSVVVYINGNDSIVKELQMEVKHLTDVIEDIESDSITISIDKVPRHSNSKHKQY